MKVLICDDEKGRAEETKQRILDAGISRMSIVLLIGNDFANEIRDLFKHVKSFIDNPTGRNGDFIGKFEGADIAIVDNNLAHLDIEGTRLTGESIAGYLRAFTLVPYIVSINKNPEVDFDLRYLVGDYSTRADLAINTQHLSNRGLWTGKLKDARDGFLPWYWPSLSSAANKRRDQWKFIESDLQRPIYKRFKFPNSAIDVLSRHAKGALSPFSQRAERDDDNVVPFDKVTFLDFFRTSSRSLPAADDRINLENAFKKDGTTAKKVITRIVSADLDLWFRRDIIGPQEALVDVPHLLMRMPFLLGKRANAIRAWQEAVTAGKPPFSMLSDVFDGFLIKHKFSFDAFIGRSPCFWWPELRENEKLNALYNPKVPWADAVFCEDTSDFVTRQPDNGDNPKEFVTEFEGPWSRRHVKHLGSLKYAPRSRFAM